MLEIQDYINNAIAAKLAELSDPESLINKEISKRIDKAVIEAVDSGFRSYKGAGELLEKKIAAEISIAITNADIATYNLQLKEKIEKAFYEAMLSDRSKDPIDLVIRTIFEKPKENIDLQEIIDKFKHSSSYYEPAFKICNEDNNWIRFYCLLDSKKLNSKDGYYGTNPIIEDIADCKLYFMHKKYNEYELSFGSLNKDKWNNIGEDKDCTYVYLNNLCLHKVIVRIPSKDINDYNLEVEGDD